MRRQKPQTNPFYIPIFISLFYAYMHFYIISRFSRLLQRLFSSLCHFIQIFVLFMLFSQISDTQTAENNNKKNNKSRRLLTQAMALSLLIFYLPMMWSVGLFQSKDKSISNQKVLPSSTRLSTPYRALCISKTLRTIESPRPVPIWARLWVLSTL